VALLLGMVIEKETLKSSKGVNLWLG